MATDTGKTTGIIYFRLNEPRYEGDVTKDCGLTGGEIDKNFNFLRGYDVKSGIWDPETSILTLERLNGEKIEIALPIGGSGSTASISFDGSFFSSESGGTLHLVANDGEPYDITGFTECCTELAEQLNALYGEVYSFENEFEIFTEDCNNNFARIFKFIRTDFVDIIQQLSDDFNAEICKLKVQIEHEKQERNRVDNSIIDTISKKEAELKTLIGQEKNVRENADTILGNLIQAEVNERKNNIRRLETALSSEAGARATEDRNIRLAIATQRNEIEQLLELEKRARETQDRYLENDITNRIVAVGDDIEAVRDYAKWLYYGSAQNLLLPCDERKWGIAIRDIEEGGNEGRREIYLNLNPNDLFLSQDCNYLASYITLKYNKDNNHIELLGKDGIVASYVDANIFIQKGFLTSAYYDSENEQLVFVWDGSSEPTRIPATDLFEPQAGNGISISGQTFAVSLGNDNEHFLRFSNGKLVTAGIQDAIDTKASQTKTQLKAYVDGLVDRIEGEISGISRDIQELESKVVYLTQFNAYTASTQSTIETLNEYISALSEDVGLMAEEIAIQKERIDNVESAVTQVSSQVRQNTQDIQTIFDIIESGGGGGSINEIVSHDDSIKVTPESGGVVNLEVNFAPVSLVSPNETLDIKEPTTGGTVSIEVNCILNPDVIEIE